MQRLTAYIWKWCSDCKVPWNLLKNMLICQKEMEVPKASQTCQNINEKGKVNTFNQSHQNLYQKHLQNFFGI